MGARALPAHRLQHRTPAQRHRPPNACAGKKSFRARSPPWRHDTGMLQPFVVKKREAGQADGVVPLELDRRHASKARALLRRGERPHRW